MTRKAPLILLLVPGSFLKTNWGLVAPSQFYQYHSVLKSKLTAAGEAL
jgi:hypothetical protein